MKCRLFLSLLLLPSLSAPAYAQQTTKKPNIIFIMADDLGWGELGCYGNTFNETHYLDSLAALGTRFTQAYAAAPVCSPTRASLLTGQYPARVGITDFLPAKTSRYLDPSAYLTINEVLAQAGYHTGIIGKWHLDTDFNQHPGGPAEHGFDEVIGSETKYIADGDYFFPYDKIGTFETGKENEYLTDRQSQEACMFIERNKEAPFFLYFSYYSVHTRLEAPAEQVEKYTAKLNNGTKEAKGNPVLAAMLERIDAGVGAIMKALEENGLAENTLLVFFSDNGGAGKVGNNGNLRSGKTWLYEGGIREPLLVCWPGKVEAGRVSDVPVYSVDFYPTFAALAGAGLPAAYPGDGQNLLPLLTGKGVPARDVFFWHYPSETGKWNRRMASAVRKGNYKLLEFYEDQRIELYNLEKDPGETNNLADSLPGKAAGLKKLLHVWLKEVNAEKPVLKVASP
ncbi:arylsulfatase A-like enzyme [Anseongella ginsenosidimutans]|uniref:Arylsulfatase A-like enzyme n=1 Tax=Anseongella ginsenosidimutans TaxID=496056 RepID=A0A4R3KSX0_9SPHI|nr:sulfatase [Anseongella ginsenosidimutans]QEC53074.1 sulfatase [Anseongella ginsenosidimutans]TCS87689.1 arylsulfatase A-like enzyme [Anseongella ginsenosidimutans]